jgi:hypothetical protein
MIAKKIEEIVNKAKTKNNEKMAVSLGAVEKRIEDDLRKGGFDIDLSGYTHEIDLYGVRHAIAEHGDAEGEAKRGQIAITDEDIKGIPLIIKNYDTVKHIGKTPKGLNVFEYRKKIDGTVVYVEEARTGKRTLTIKTMWKFKR